MVGWIQLGLDWGGVGWDGGLHGGDSWRAVGGGGWCFGRLLAPRALGAASYLRWAGGLAARREERQTRVHGLMVEVHCTRLLGGFGRRGESIGEVGRGSDEGGHFARWLFGMVILFYSPAGNFLIFLWFNSCRQWDVVVCWC